MIELLIFVLGVVVIWKFSSVFSSASIGAEEIANSWSEETIAECTLDRVDLHDDFVKRLDNREIITHEDFLRKLGKRVR